MAKAIVENGQLCSPTVGTWFRIPESISCRQPVRLGRLLQSGRWVIFAPDGSLAIDPCGGRGRVVRKRCTLFEIRSELTDAAGSHELNDGTSVDGCPEDCIVITSDTDGTVYLRPDPSLHYAVEGATCSAKETVALVEVMKTFSPVRAPSTERWWLCMWPMVRLCRLRMLSVVSTCVTCHIKRKNPHCTRWIEKTLPDNIEKLGAKSFIFRIIP